MYPTYDSNPMLHKLSIEDIARANEARSRRSKNPTTMRFKAIAMMASLAVAAVISLGSNIV